MSDTLDRISWFSKDIKSSEYIYGVPACYFLEMKYKFMLTKKITLAQNLMQNILETEAPYASTEPKENEEYSKYQLIEMRLNAVEKAIEFNEFLLKELEDCKG